MVLSGIAMVVFDSRIIQRWYRRILTRIRTRFHRHQPEPQTELGVISNTESVQPSSAEETPVTETIRIDSGATKISGPGSGPSRRQVAQQEEPAANTSEPISVAQAVRSDEVKVPYSILIGLTVFAFFLISFVVIMVVRGVVKNSPVLFQFFANMYLAGDIRGFCVLC